MSDKLRARTDCERTRKLTSVVIATVVVELTALLMSIDPLDGMRARIAQCRRLAKSTTDARTRDVLNQMAEEGEADLRRLEAERAGHEQAPHTELDRPPTAKA